MIEGSTSSPAPLRSNLGQIILTYVLLSVSFYTDLSAAMLYISKGNRALGEK